MTCDRCGADHLALTFAPGSREPAGVLCLACGAWTDGAGSAPPPSEGRNGRAASCGCEPELDDDGFARLCDYCATTWAGTRCIHDVHQEPCPECAVCPVPQLA